MKDSSGLRLNADEELAQRKYLESEAGNTCKWCGAGNPGTIVPLRSSGTMLLHYCLYSTGDDENGRHYERCTSGCTRGLFFALYVAGGFELSRCQFDEPRHG